MILQPIDNEYAKRLIEKLLDVNSVEERLYYAGLANKLLALVSLTGSIDETAAILVAVVNQAYLINESTEWVEQELRFEEGVASVGDRKWMLHAEFNTDEDIDQALDLYNIRLRRKIKTELY
ncbi:hypothetical protein G8759_34200 [Spirosoma aureum]|uniref:Uncharacterized protein n=1 Tax=Spirosoma aureum TaxID=2692134 RepID=A0A6G9AY96_9BACT|nr:hypothetical protein [Spirosoma aureum]QIP17336.1 hypothetical protein G8759_34200 [Spirosoma aureum]